MNKKLHNRFFNYTVLLFAISSLILSCGPARPKLESYRKQSPDATNLRKTRDQIIHFAREQIGCKYKTAGKCKTGFDCSGFVIYVYREFEIPMAATAHDQAKLGQSIELENAIAGDLIFFGSAKQISHVGIISKNTKKDLSIIHSSSSKGVIEENILNSDYWLRRIQKVTSLNSYLKMNEVSFNN
jgi:cell wall-associated NlpC family hydrolase